MQVNNNNLSMKSNTNFTAIKSINCRGLYNKYPQLANELVDTFKLSPKAMDFCKKYDVDIVFYAVKKEISAVESSIHIFYKNIAKSKFKRFFDSINCREDKVSLSQYTDEYNIDESIKASTNYLKECIMPKGTQANNYHNGMLDIHLTSTDNEIQKVLAKKEQLAMKKNIKLESKIKAKDKFNDDNIKLNSSIKDLIDKSK